MKEMVEEASGARCGGGYGGGIGERFSLVENPVVEVVRIRSSGGGSES